MPNDTRELPAKNITVMPGSGGRGDAGDDLPGDAGLWLTGGASLLAWTALALLLTSA